MVIGRAAAVCLNSGQAVDNHFHRVVKMVEIGSNTVRNIGDWKLDRYACYLVAQNGDSKKPEIALAQTYFAIQTRKQEIFGQLSETDKRLFIRGEVSQENKRLFSTAKRAGVTRFGSFNDAGYRGLYGMPLGEIETRKGIKKGELLDRAGTTELAANLFRITQTEDKLKKDKIKGDVPASRVHFMVGGKVRQTIKDIGGTTPENLPPEKHIKELKKGVRYLYFKKALWYTSFMPRLPRVDVGNEIYHVINRANARLPIFFEEADFRLFECILEEAREKYDMRILAYCLMPNHFHLVLHPRGDSDLQKFMQWLTLTHTQRWHAKNNTAGTGHLYQGRYKSFITEGDSHLLAVIRYVERNPLRAKLVTKIENWDFSSLSRRLKDTSSILLSPWPIIEPDDYIAFVNIPMTETEEEALRYSVNRGKPFGTDEWSNEMIKRHGLLAAIRKKGRPKKGT